MLKEELMVHLSRLEGIRRGVAYGLEVIGEVPCP
jgi:hypothetical protein